MITFERSFDYDLIRSVLTHPRLYRYLADDTSPPAYEFTPQQHPAIWYVTVRDDRELLGLWMFVPQNGVCWEVHTALLPNAWGERGQLAARLLPGWMWRNTSCRRIVSNVPTTNRLALHFALKAGMKIFGVNEASFLKNGVLCDQVMLGISKPFKVPIADDGIGLESIAVAIAEALEPPKEEACQQPQFCHS
ncbi:MAG: hypothetical protein C5B60_08835 [Chloroflexi bacterium]|nr:MAG: hypothetical protein C5B60_08835 [Chloroflexota bacterium]